MHCVAGDGIAGAVIGSRLHVSAPAHVALGFGFGWSIFQALFMRGMAGGSFRRALSLPELLSMNTLMAGMVPVMFVLMLNIAEDTSAVP
jgi:hypothetical protein